MTEVHYELRGHFGVGDLQGNTLYITEPTDKPGQTFRARLLLRDRRHNADQRATYYTTRLPRDGETAIDTNVVIFHRGLDWLAAKNAATYYWLCEALGYDAENALPAAWVEVPDDLTRD